MERIYRRRSMLDLIRRAIKALLAVDRYEMSGGASVGVRKLRKKDVTVFFIVRYVAFLYENSIEEIMNLPYIKTNFSKTWLLGQTSN